MIKAIFLTSILLSVSFISVAKAQNKVVVIPLGSDTYQLSIEPAELFSWYDEVQDAETLTVTTVPDGKILVVTSLITESFNNTRKVALFEGDNKKTQINTLATTENTLNAREFSFGSGITFSSGSVVKVSFDGANNSRSDITIIGHFSSAQ